MSTAIIWLRSIRPKTLTAAVIPVVVGSALAVNELSQFDQRLSFLALFGALFIQIATNLFNDALDFKKGADTAERLGPKRATQSGWLTQRQVQAAGVIFLSLAVVCGIPLVIQGGWVLLSIGLASLLLAYLYTGGPLPLAYWGLGDVFVLLFFGIVALGGTYYLHGHTYSLGALIAGVQVGALATVLIAINNLRDIEQDRKAGKRTLAVLLGPTFVRYEIAFLYGLSFCLGAYWWSREELWVAILPLATLPMAVRVVKGVVFTEPGPIYNSFLARSALVQILFGFLFSMGLIGTWPQP